MQTPRPVRVLVVDDHAAFRLALAGVLRRAGDLELVGEAASGEEALEQARGLSPDVVVLDVRMPGLGGIATAALLRAEHPDVLVLLCSSYDRADLPAGVQEPGPGIAYAPKEEVGPGLVRRLWQEHVAPQPALDDARLDTRDAAGADAGAGLTPLAAPPPA